MSVTTHRDPVSQTSDRGDGDDLLTAATLLLDRRPLAPHHPDMLWSQQGRLPEVTGFSLQELAGDQLHSVFTQHLKQAERSGVFARLQQYSVQPSTASGRDALLADIDRLAEDVVFQGMLKPQVLWVEKLREQVSRDQRIGPDIVDEGWVLPHELKKGGTYYTAGVKPFTVRTVKLTDPGKARVEVEDSGGSSFIELNPDTLVAPERTPSWQAAAVAVAEKRGITPQRAALWFGAGELYRITREPDKSPKGEVFLNEHERTLWCRALDEITLNTTGENSEQFAFRILGRAYSGPVESDGGLTHRDLDDLQFVLEAAAEKGLDLVRLGVASQRALFTSKMGWEQAADFDPVHGTLFGTDLNLQGGIPSHIDTVFRAALWNHGTNILSHGSDLRHFKGVETAPEVETKTLGRYVPQKVRKDGDSFSKAIDALKDKPSLEAARAIVKDHENEIRTWLQDSGIEISDSLVVIPAPSSSKAAQYLAQSIAELFSADGVEWRQVFQKRQSFIRSGTLWKQESVAKGVKGAFNFYERVARAYIGTEIKPSAGVASGKDLLIVDDITTMGCTRDVSCALAALFKPRKVAFLAAGETK